MAAAITPVAATTRDPGVDNSLQGARHIVLEFQTNDIDNADTFASGLNNIVAFAYEGDAVGDLAAPTTLGPYTAGSMVFASAANSSGFLHLWIRE